MGTLQRYSVVIIMLAGSISAQSDEAVRIDDSVRIQNESLSKPVKNPLISGAISAVVPGGGQIYTKRYVKAGAYLALEAITASVARFWYKESQARYQEAEKLNNVLLVATTWNDSMLLKEKKAVLRFNAKSARYSMYNALSWMVGGYIYNVLDAIEGSGYFTSDSEKSPLKAALLSTVPGFGLGQIYNGSISKAGMVMMTQVSLGVKVVNEHRLMTKAQDHISKALQIKDTAGVAFVAEEFNKDWESRRHTAFKNRNMYLWYSLFFYFYQILDAVVDAHLHDYPKKMRAYPDLIPELSAFGLNFDYFF